MKRVGFTELFVDEIGNVVGRMGLGQGRRLLYDAHLDTVGIGDPTSWSRDPCGAQVEDGVIYGRGAADNKGAMAAMIYGAKLLLDSDIELAGDLFVAGVVQEEVCEGYAAEILCRRVKPQAVVLGEATNLQISRGQRGRMALALTVRGRSCHASAPERGANAIYLMNPVVARIEALASQLKRDDFLGPGSLAVTRIESTSGGLNVVPDSCTIYLDRRLTVEEDEALTLSQVQEAAAQAGVEAEVRLLEYEARSHTGYPCHQKEYFPPWTLPPEHPLVETGVRAVEKALGYTPEVGRWLFSTDGVATMGRLAIPTIGFGPGEEGHAHTTEDQVRLEDLVKAAQVYARLAIEFLGRR
jgi:putative selenium metabolism hydrolase